ncbi:MAG: hypothetical protein JWN05_1880, partial [Arthrobacter sp.]|nr:hypothetical protein [Arthrobacter sp.]
MQVGTTHAEKLGENDITDALIQDEIYYGGQAS